jgi:hypothetical protein
VERGSYAHPEPSRSAAHGPEKSNGARSLVIFDGKQVSAFDEAGRVYAQAPQPGGVDETLVYFVRDLGMRLPLAFLSMSRGATDLDRRVKSGSTWRKRESWERPPTTSSDGRTP